MEGSGLALIWKAEKITTVSVSVANIPGPVEYEAEVRLSTGLQRTFTVLLCKVNRLLVKNEDGMRRVIPNILGIDVMIIIMIIIIIFIITIAAITTTIMHPQFGTLETKD